METQTRLKASGLQWLASRDPERWITPRGKAHITRIAKDAGVGRSSLHELLRGNRGLGRKMEDRLRDLAVSTGVSHDRAHNELFEPVDIADSRVAA